MDISGNRRGGPVTHRTALPFLFCVAFSLATAAFGAAIFVAFAAAAFVAFAVAAFPVVPALPFLFGGGSLYSSSPMLSLSLSLLLSSFLFFLRGCSDLSGFNICRLWLSVFTRGGELVGFVVWGFERVWEGIVRVLCGWRVVVGVVVGATKE